jgi:hypothetical protein
VAAAKASSSSSCGSGGFALQQLCNVVPCLRGRTLWIIECVVFSSGRSSSSSSAISTCQQQQQLEAAAVAAELTCSCSYEELLGSSSSNIKSCSSETCKRKKSHARGSSKGYSTRSRTGSSSSHGVGKGCYSPRSSSLLATS